MTTPVIDARDRSLDAVADYDHVVFNLGDHRGFHGLVYEASRRHPGVCVLHDRKYDNLVADRDRGDAAIDSFRVTIAGALGVAFTRTIMRERSEPTGSGPSDAFRSRCIRVTCRPERQQSRRSDRERCSVSAT